MNVNSNTDDINPVIPSIRGETIAGDETELNPNLTPGELLREIALSLKIIERRDSRSRQRPLTTMPTIPIQSTSDAGSITTVNQKWVVPATFKVAYYLFWTDVATWINLRIGSTAKGPYRLVPGTNKIELEDIILGGNDIQVDGISSATTVVRMQMVGAYASD